MKLSYKIGVTVLLILLPLLLLILAIFIKDKYQDSHYKISPDEAKKLIKNKAFDVILDVRTDSERKTYGLYPGSVNINISELERRFPSEFPNKNLHILVYCKSGRRARIAIETLQQLGYKNVKYITGLHTSLL